MQNKQAKSRKDRIIFHTALAREWNAQKDKSQYWQSQIDKNPRSFIHCSDNNTLSLILGKFAGTQEQVFVVSIDTNKLNEPEILKWEEHKGTDYPHLYGVPNDSAIVNTVWFVQKKNDFSKDR